MIELEIKSSNCIIKCAYIKTYEQCLERDGHLQLLALPFIAFFHLGSYNTYEISQLILLTNHMGLFISYSLSNL
jgi:hypothetical protein